MSRNSVKCLASESKRSLRVNSIFNLFVHSKKSSSISNFIRSQVFGFKTNFIASRIAVFQESFAQIRILIPFSKFRSRFAVFSKLVDGQYFLKFQSLIFDRYIFTLIIEHNKHDYKRYHN